MNKALDLDELPQSENLYIEALAEAYNNAASWDTRRQVLSIMSGVASYNVISMYIPGLTKYRYTMANLHRLQFGRGAPVPKQATTRIRIDIKQLDHFISFITSLHLVQDLPFGQRHLKLSSGEVINVPNVIRQMIPQRIVRQYTQYCLILLPDITFTFPSPGVLDISLGEEVRLGPSNPHRAQDKKSNSHRA